MTLLEANLASPVQGVAANKGLYFVALASGLTDAGAGLLSTLRMFNLEKVEQDHAVVGGRPLARQALPGLLAIGAGMGVGLFVL